MPGNALGREGRRGVSSYGTENESRGSFGRKDIRRLRGSQKFNYTPALHREVRDGLDGRSNCGWNVNDLNVARSVQKEAHLLGIRLFQERAQRNPRAMLASFELKVPFRNAVDTTYQERRYLDEYRVRNEALGDVCAPGET